MKYFYVCTSKNTKNSLAIRENILYNERVKKYFLSEVYSREQKN